MESNVLNHKSEQGKSQTTKKEDRYICVCAHTHACGYRIGMGRAFPVFLQCPISLFQAGSHYIGSILKPESILSSYVIQCTLGNGFQKLSPSKEDYE